MSEKTKFALRFLLLRLTAVGGRLDDSQGRINPQIDVNSAHAPLPPHPFRWRLPLRDPTADVQRIVDLVLLDGHRQQWPDSVEKLPWILRLSWL